MASFRVAAPDDLDSIARLYCAAFPMRARRYVDTPHAAAFWKDYFSLLRGAHSESFLIAEIDGRFAGFMLITLPGVGMRLAGIGQMGRIALRAITGRYGFPLRQLRSLLRGGRSVRPPPELAVLAHLDAIAIEPTATRRGIAREFLLLGRERLAGRAPALWLRVETDNAGAIRLYESVGMRKIGGAPDELWMAWPWREPIPPFSSTGG